MDAAVSDIKLWGNKPGAGSLLKSNMKPDTPHPESNACFKQGRCQR